MSMTPIDRGFAHLVSGSRGLTIAVSTSAAPVAMLEASPREVFAVHYAVQSVDVGDGVEIVTDGSGRRTSGPVAVQARDGVVYLRSATAGASLGSLTD